ncbi:MAG TPA: biotin/lipoyl-binding protein [Elusimicrobiota bacterium]|nr:biotin/lipoyl-binding protein [Elusimicrobiota bacterium]
MAESQIFRKSSLEKLSTPEQLDTLMQVTSSRGWLALWAICGLLVLGLLWSVFGRLPTTITGRAIIMPPTGVKDVYAPDGGFVTDILVKEGDVVQAGQVVAHLEQPDLREKIANSRKELEAKIRTLEARTASLTKLAASKKEALRMGLISSDDLDNTQQALRNAQDDLTNARLSLELIEDQLVKASEVRAPAAAQVVEVLTMVHTLVPKGESLFTYVESDAEMNAVAFIPNVGNEAKVGMKVQVSPTTFKKEEFGSILGTVNYVSEFPARTHALFNLTHNHLLNQELTSTGDPYIIKATLTKDPKTVSGYRWSSSQGPKEKISAGTLCTIRIITREERPIVLVIPALKSLLGL